MIQSIKNFAVNWTDGMKISEKHLIAHDDFLLDTVRDTNSLRCNNFNYGLLPIPTVKGSDDMIFDVLNTATNDVQVVIKHCSALTAAGYRIDLSDYRTNVKSLMKSVDNKQTHFDEAYYILISSNPFARIPFGDIDPEETPPRHPYTQTKYSIELLSESFLKNGATSGNYLIIGKVNMKDNIASADKNFIPPCTSIHSHPVLLGYYGTFAKSMGDLQQYALTIIRKTAKVNQSSTLASNVKNLCGTLLNHLSSIYFNYRNIVPQQAPIYMVDVFSSMALRIYYFTEVLESGELEEMLNYTFEWSEIAPHMLTNQLSAVADLNYDHNDCGEHFLAIQRLLKSLEIIFSKLSDLDYIGQRRENIIVHDTDITPTPKTKSGWSLLD